MCTLVILRRPGHDWPVLIAANRDEMVERPWLPPARHWPDRPEVVAGLDEQAGGTWLGLNDRGVVAGILNRPHSLGTAPDKRSRGEIVLDALDFAEAADAAEALSHVDARAYRPFNLVIADNNAAFWLRLSGDDDNNSVDCFKIAEGISMITAHDINDAIASDRTRHYLPKFKTAITPDPDAKEWSDWETLLKGNTTEDGAGPGGALMIQTDFGFATTSSSLIALPSQNLTETKPIWRFAAGRPDREAYRLVDQ